MTGAALGSRGWRRGWRRRFGRRRGRGGSGAGVSVTLTSIGAPPLCRKLPFERDETFVLEAEQIISGRQVLECDASRLGGRLPLCRTFDRHLDAAYRLAVGSVTRTAKVTDPDRAVAAGRRGADAGGCGAD